MRKREDFAISLRKEKKKAIIQMKRRKIAQLTKGKGQLVKSETSDVQPYRGYPKWKSDLYEEHGKILLSIFEKSGESIEYFQAVDPNDQVKKLCDIYEERKLS